MLKRTSLLRRSRFWPLVLLLLGLLGAAGVGLLQQRANEHRARQQIEAAAARMGDQLRRRMQSYEYGLVGTRGVMAAVAPLPLHAQHASFLRFMDSFTLQRRFPGARGIGFVRLLPREQEARFVADMQRDIDPGFRVWGRARGAGQSATGLAATHRFVLQFVQPELGGEETAGFDLGTHPKRLAALLKAMSDGAARLSAPLPPARDGDRTVPTVLLVLPVYADGGGWPAATLQDRRDVLVGWAQMPLIFDDVLAELDFEDDALAMAVSDITDQGAPARVYTSALWHTAAAEGAALKHEVRLDLYGRIWQLQVQARPSFVEQLALRSPWAVSAGLVLFTTLLALLLHGRLRAAAQQEQALQQRAGMAAVVESSHDAIVVHDLEGRINSWNPAAARILGWTAGEAIGRNLFELVVPSHAREQAREVRKRIGCGESVQPFDTVRLTREGAEVEMLVSVAPVHDEAGRFTGAATTMRDMRGQRAAQARILELNMTLEQQVRRQTLELRALLDKAASAIIATDLRGRITVFNPAAERMLRLPAGQAIGRSELDFRDHDEMRARMHLYPREVLEHTGQLPDWLAQAAHAALAASPPGHDASERSEWTYVRADGTHVPGLTNISVLRDERDRPTGFLAVITDLTERKVLEEQLRERTRQAESANAAKSTFLANMSHEIRTPLNAVIGMSQLLAQTELGERQRLFVTHIHAAGQQLLALVNDILDLSKIEAGEMRLESVPFELQALLRQSLALVEVQAAQKNLPLQLEVDPDTPQRLVGDPTRLQQVLVNLLGNAVKFTETGSVTLRVRLLERLPLTPEQPRPRAVLRIEVADTGIGIAPAQQAAIFEPFTQAEASTTRRFGGTGLGLSIVRRLVNLVGGRLELHSEPGRGSTFAAVVTLPVAD